MEETIISEEAAGWLVRLEEDSSNQCRTEFRVWLEKSPKNMSEFLLVTAAYRELEGIDAGKEIQIEGLVERAVKAEVVKLGRRPLTLPSSEGWNGGERRKRRLFVAAAGVAAAGVLGWLIVPSLMTPGYKTDIGEQRAVKLDDGSVVQLNTRSRVEVQFSDVARDVQLMQGEALFVVEKDAKRPFRVVTETATIQALGTQFNVYRHDDTTTVSVLEGLVRVQSAHGRQDVAAGEAARVNKDGRIDHQTSAEVDKAVAWRQRKLDFRGTPLAQVAAEFNRYNEVQIEVEPDAGTKELNGVFNADEPQSLLKFLEQDPALRVEHDDKRLLIRIR